MCGIFGYLQLDFNTPADPSWLPAMGHALHHRGPDAGGVHVDGPCALGHRRLSIIDLTDKALQPMLTEDKSIAIVFNGEIYNYQELIPYLTAKGHVFRSRSDTEVLLRLYAEEGMEALKKIKGMFAFALWDKRKQCLFLARDRMGIKPLHFAQVQNTLIFASEIKGLLAHPKVSRQIDPRAFEQYLALEYVPAPLSMFKEVRKVEPGHYLKMTREELTHHSYWSASPFSIDASKRTERDYAEELRHLLQKTIQRSMISDVPLGAFLSGGLDSSTVCAWMKYKNAGKVKTFSIGFEDTSFDETAFARTASQALGTEHYEERLSARDLLERVPKAIACLDEPLADASIFPTMLLCEFAKRYVTVALSGDGGDELFAGYPTYQAHHWASVFCRLPKALRGQISSLANRLPVSHKNMSLDFKIKKFLSSAAETHPALRNALWLGAFSPAEIQRALVPDIMKTVPQNPFAPIESFFDSLSHGSDLEKILLCDQRFYLQDDVLTKVDRASMACSLEVRVPLLEQEIVEFAARLPIQFKLRGGQPKYLLKRVMRNLLPKMIINRQKKGFGVPLGRWFQNELKPLLQETFPDSEQSSSMPFKADEVQRLLKQHWNGQADHRKKIYTLLTFELWRRHNKAFF